MVNVHGFTFCMHESFLGFEILRACNVRRKMGFNLNMKVGLRFLFPPSVCLPTPFIHHSRDRVISNLSGGTSYSIRSSYD